MKMLFLLIRCPPSILDTKQYLQSIKSNSSLLVPKNTGYTIFYIACIYQITSIGTWVPIHLILESFKVWLTPITGFISQSPKGEARGKSGFRIFLIFSSC